MELLQPAGCLFMTLLIHSGSAGGAGRGPGIKHCLELRAGRRLVEHSALDVVTGETYNLSKNIIGHGLLYDIFTLCNARAGNVRGWMLTDICGVHPSTRPPRQEQGWI